MKLEELRDQENFISYFEAYSELTPTYQQKRIRHIRHDVNKQKYNVQTTSHGDSFSVTFSDHSNGVVSTIV